MSNLFQELKRRNVVRVGAIYLIVGWLLVQVADTIAPMMILPEWAPRVVLYFLILGLPVALFLSWAYELTPEGAAPDQGVAGGPGYALGRRKIDIVIAVVGALAIGYFIWTQSGESGPEAPTAGAGTDKIALVVLPFADLSQAGDQEYLGDGVAEEILNVLTGLDGLKVTSRTSAFAFKGRNLSIPEIAESLGVSHVVEGSIRKQDNRVRITAQLIDVSDDSHLWSETYDAELTDIFALQDEIANRILAALSASLDLSLPTVERLTPIWDIAAYELYLRGRQAIELRGIENTTKAATLLEAALAIEPEFADAWAELAAAESLTALVLNMSHAGSVEVAARYEAAWDAGARAVALDPANSLGLAVQGAVRQSQYRYIESRILLERAVAVENPVMNAFLWLGMLQALTGTVDDALETFDRALAIDPKAPNIHRWIGILLGNRRDFAAAQPHNRIAADLDIVVASGRWLTYEVLLGRADVRALEDPEAPGNMLSLPEPEREHILLAVRGYTDPAARRELIAREAEISLSLEMPLSLMIFTLVETGPDDLVNRLLTAGVEGGESAISLFLSALIWNPGQSDFRKTEAFLDFARKREMDRYWAIYGWPGQCRPLGGEEFECE